MVLNGVLGHGLRTAQEWWGLFIPPSPDGSALLGRKGRGKSGLFLALEWEECSQLYLETSLYAWSQFSSTSSITSSLPPQLPGGSAVTGKGQGPAGDLGQEGLNSNRSVLGLFGWSLGAVA